MRQHEHLEKLNIQAHHSALTRHDEFVVDAFVMSNQMTTLVHELVVIEIWRERVFPILLQRDCIDNDTSLKAYMILYHEATICNLLEILLYHRSCLESISGDGLIELVDYCYRKVAQLNAGVIVPSPPKSYVERLAAGEIPGQGSRGDKEGELDEETRLARLQEALKEAKTYLDETPRDALLRQSKDIAFSTAVCALSIVRFVTDQLPNLPQSILSRVTETQDLVLSLVPLVENPPWTRKITPKGGEPYTEKYIDQKWVVVPADQLPQLTKVEGQVWLSIYNLLMEKAVREIYTFTAHRRNIIIRLRRFFTDELLDQLPLLTPLRRLVDELAVAPMPPASSKVLAIIEQVPEIREELLKREDWTEIAMKQAEKVFTKDPEARKRDAATLARAYDLDLLDEVLEEPKCMVCGEAAASRCARCKLVWYCSRACQVKAWPSHKSFCNSMAKVDAEKKQAQTPEGTSAAKEAASVAGTTPASESSSTSSTEPRLHQGIQIVEEDNKDFLNDVD